MICPYRGQRRPGFAFPQLRDAEVHQQRGAAPIDHHIGRFEVAVNDGLIVDRLEAVHELERDVVPFVGAEAARAMRTICPSSIPSTNCIEMNRTDCASP